jgi:hypothetical protein
MSLTWSFSSERNFRRCQRQFYFREIMACHNARDPRRREAFLLKQLKSLELWRGNLIHLGIERFIVPALASGSAIPWDDAITSVLAIAREQFAFSAAARFREPGLSKTKAGDSYCALWPHAHGQAVDTGDVAEVEEKIVTAFRNLSQMNDFFGHLRNRSRYQPECRLHVPYHDGQVVDMANPSWWNGRRMNEQAEPTPTCKPRSTPGHCAAVESGKSRIQRTSSYLKCSC